MKGTYCQNRERNVSRDGVNSASLGSGSSDLKSLNNLKNNWFII